MLHRRGRADAQADRTAEERGRRPNIILVLVDDMRGDDLAYMPNVRRLLTGRGVRFANAYAVNPQCRPSRASILTGDYAHTTGVMFNRNGSSGGWVKFRPHESDTVATRLDRVGYQTGLIGKYMNGYAVEAPRHVPPGWDTWKVPVRGEHRYRGRVTYNLDGTLRDRAGRQDGIRAAMARKFIRSASARPMFLYLSFLAPHSTPGGNDPIPYRQDRHAYDGIDAPSNPAVNENVADKPDIVRRPALTARDLREIASTNENRRESLLAVDRHVSGIVAALRRERVLRNTFIVFASDNGYFLGEHRIKSGKALHYESSTSVPLVMRGPGLPEGAVRHQVVGLHDLAPTFQRWAGANPREPADGINLTSVAARDTPLTRDLLIESLKPRFMWREYDAIRTDNWKYVEYVGGDVELYNLRSDRWETTNLAGDATYSRRQHMLADRLAAVRDCTGTACH